MCSCVTLDKWLSHSVPNLISLSQWNNKDKVEVSPPGWRRINEVGLEWKALALGGACFLNLPLLDQRRASGEAVGFEPWSIFLSHPFTFYCLHSPYFLLCTTHPPLPSPSLPCSHSLHLPLWSAQGPWVLAQQVNLSPRWKVEFPPQSPWSLPQGWLRL